MAITILAIFIYFLIFSIPKLSSLKKEKQLKDLVAWCVTEDNSIRYNFSLYAYLHNVQSKLNIEEKYRLNREKEGVQAEYILNDFQHALIQGYFRGAIPPQKSKYAIEGEDFFMMSLFMYLSNKCDEYSIGNMYIKDCGKYTDFGIVIIKMYHIAFLYCKNSQVYRSNIPGWLTSEGITSMIDHREP